MNRRTFQSWCGRFGGITHALMNITNDRNIWADGAKVVSIGVELMDLEFLATSPIDEMFNSFVSPRIYSVPKYGKPCNVIGEEAYSNFQQQVCVVPYALYFMRAGAYDVKYVVYVIRSGWPKIDYLKVIIYQPQPLLGLEIQEVVAAFENGGWQGVEDLRSRFTTGVGLGRATAERAEMLNHQEVSRRAIQAGSRFNQMFRGN